MILFILRLTLHACCGSITRNFKLISGSTFNMFVCFQLAEYTITIFSKQGKLSSNLGKNCRPTTYTTTYVHVSFFFGL